MNFENSETRLENEKKIEWVKTKLRNGDSLYTVKDKIYPPSQSCFIFIALKQRNKGNETRLNGDSILFFFASLPDNLRNLVKKINSWR